MIFFHSNFLRKWFPLSAVIFVAIYVLVIAIAPSFLDKKMNTIVISAPYQVDKKAAALYDSLDFIGDLHSDVLLWQRDILKEHAYGHEDIPRMLQANIALQAFTIVNKTPVGINFDRNTGDTDQITRLFMAQGRPLKSWFSLTERVITQADSLHEFSQLSEGKLSIIKSRKDLLQYIKRREGDKELTAGFLGIEGAQALEGKLENIDIVFEAGVRMIGLTHFFDNELGASAHGVIHGGITDFGREALKKMEEMKIIIDLSHAAPKLIDDVLASAKNPIIVSHTGVKGTCDNVRNLSDQHLSQIAQNGGLIGIAMFDQAICGADPDAIAKAIIYTANLVGIEHVALGSDFDGAVKTIFDVRGLPLIVEALLKSGMPEKDVRLVMGDNIKRFLLENLPGSPATLSTPPPLTSSTNTL